MSPDPQQNRAPVNRGSPAPQYCWWMDVAKVKKKNNFVLRFTESWYAEITPNWNQPYMRQCFAHLKKCLEPVYATNFVCHIACTWESLLFQPPLPVVWVNVYILHSGTWCMFPRDTYTVNINPGLAFRAEQARIEET